MINDDSRFSIENVQIELNKVLPCPIPTPFLFKVRSEYFRAVYEKLLSLDYDSDHILNEQIEFAIFVESNNEKIIPDTNELTSNSIIVLVRDIFEKYWINKFPAYIIGVKKLIFNCDGKFSSKRVQMGDFFSCYSQNTLVLFGETKERLAKVGKLFEDEIERRTAALHPVYYENLPFIICFLCDENFIKFFIYYRGFLTVTCVFI